MSSESPAFVPEEEDGLRLPPQLKAQLARFIQQQQRQSRQSSASEDDNEFAESLQRMEREIEQLQFRNSALEAQNVLVSVQQLDIFARLTAWILSLSCLFLYWRVAWFLCLQLYTVAVFWVPIVPAKLAVNFGLRLILLVLPYWYNQRSHGSTHRRFQVFVVAFIIIGRVRLCRWREKMFIKPDELAEASENNPLLGYGEAITEEAMWEANYEVSARFLYVSILRLKGLWTKSAQYLSSRADFMPKSYVRELKRLQDEAPATPWSEIEVQLSPAIRAALVDLDEKPLASASIGQVHAARLRKSGERVVVKVQHPHAKTLIQDDLWSLQVIARIVSWMEPDYEFFEILMREWARETRKELDFRREQKNLADAKAAVDRFLQSSPNSLLYTNQSDGRESVPFQIEIPRPINELSSESVLVMTFCDGVRIDDFKYLDQNNLVRETVIDGVTQAFAYMMYVGDIFNGDPHPGNLLVRQGVDSDKSKGFTITILDWGLAKRLPLMKRLAFCQMVYAASTFDYGLLMDSYKTIGLQMKREDAGTSMEHMRFFLRDMAPSTKARKRIKAKIKKDEEHRKTLKKEEKVPVKSKAYPGEFFFFVRVNELLHGLGSKFGVNMSFLDILKPYAEQGLRKSSLYSVSLDKIPQSSAVPESVDPDLDLKLKQIFKDLDNEGMLTGAQLYVLDKKGNKIADIVAGTFGGLKSHVPMHKSALILGFSCTKAIAATMAHIMVEEGYLNYDEPVCDRVWPEFCPTEKAPLAVEEALQPDLTVEEIRKRWYWKRQITLWHILTHQAGMWSSIPVKFSIKKAASCEESVAAFEYNAESPEETLLPSSAPADSLDYHYLSFGWLVAGTLCGAFAKKHGLQFVSFEAVYNAILLPRLSKPTVSAGFCPCGGSGGFPLALTVTDDLNASKLMQQRRELQAMGEDGSDIAMDTSMYERLKDFRGKEFLLDPRIWNSVDGLDANVPAAAGRFSAAGLAHFYHDLGAGKLLSPKVLEDVTSVSLVETGKSILQGLTSTQSEKDDNKNRTSFGCGYQKIRLDSDGTDAPSAFGHAGVGGSIGFYHKPTGLSVGLMLNKADGGQEVTLRIMKVLANHFRI